MGREKSAQNQANQTQNRHFKRFSNESKAEETKMNRWPSLTVEASATGRLGHADGTTISLEDFNGAVSVAQAPKWPPMTCKRIQTQFRGHDNDEVTPNSSEQQRPIQGHQLDRQMLPRTPRPPIAVSFHLNEG